MQLKSNRVKYVESKLNVILPIEYSEFLDNFGDYEVDGMEIYGYTEDYIDITQVPCVIGATRIYRDGYSLKSYEIVISYTGYEENIIILNTKTGEIFEVDLNGAKNKLSNSFHEWFQTIKKS
jgi:hypothetical protein